MHAAQDRPHYLDDLLLRLLREFLGEIDPAALALMRQHLEWVELPGGQTLMTQGEPGDAMYLVVSGRLRTYITDDDGQRNVVREITRGQTVGEMSLYTDEPRSATLVAIRDTVLARLGKAEFKQLLTVGGQFSVALTRQIIHRSRTIGTLSVLARPVTIGLLPISAGVELAGFAERLAAELRAKGRVAIVDAARLDTDLGEPGISHRDASDLTANRRIAVRLDEIEAEHDFVLLLSDDQPTAWTRRCSRHCDELLLVADADQPPVVHAIEAQCLLKRPAATDAAEVLVLLHPAERPSPQGTAAWLARREVSDHVHVRPALPRDMARLARLLSRTAVGLVLAGGGARGLAHLGVYRALQEQGIEVDVVGGTSIGSVMAALVACDQPVARVTQVAREAFSTNPTGDFNLMPLMSLIRGQRLRKTVDKALHQLFGFEVQVEDLWKNYYCVATNYTRACEQVITAGSLRHSMLASIAIPGALPPVIHQGDLLCDGGTFNNFPVDVMRRRRGIGQVIGVDLNGREPRRIDIDEVPSPWALLRDRLRARGQRRFRLPSLPAYLMNVTILYSVSRQRQARKLTDLYFNPPLERVGMLAWRQFDKIVEQGYQHALGVLTPPGTAAAAVP